MPGGIDARTHIMFTSVPQIEVLTGDGPSAFAEGSSNRPKHLEMFDGTDNAQLLALSGLRSPCAGGLGVVLEGALADLLLVDANPLADIKLIDNPARNFVVIMKDGQICKNSGA